MRPAVRFACVISLILTGCDRSPSESGPLGKQPAQSPKKADSPPSPSLPTPHLDELAEIDRAFRSDTSLLTAYVKPNSPGLVLLDPPTPDGHDKLVALLTEWQPFVLRAIELSKVSLETFPPSPPMDGTVVDAYLKHPKAHLQQVTRILLSDAGYRFDVKDPDAALDRLAATLRFASAMLAEHEQLVRLMGAGIAGQASLRLSAMVETDLDLMKRANRQSVAGVIDAYSRIDSVDPANMIGEWEQQARESLSHARGEYLNRGGGKTLAEELREWGINAGAQMPVADPDGDDLLALFPTKDSADRVEQLTKSQIETALNVTESAIPAIAAALRARDRVSLNAALAPVRADKTTVSRWILGGAQITLSTSKSLGKGIEAGKHAAATLLENR